MLAFSTAADVVTPNRIGTSAAIVNGFMLMLGGLMIQRPGSVLVWESMRGLHKAHWS
jgi:hypothetical protein